MRANSSEQAVVTYRPPVTEDGAEVFKLVSRCPPLDPNSMYCNLLQCSHFAATSVAAVSLNELVGFVSGYLLPERPDTLFIWQVAVDETVRGQGVASAMVNDILMRPQCSDVRYLETSITEANKGSWALFRRLGQQWRTELNVSVMFDCERHFDNAHDTEMLVRVGPFRMERL